MFFRISALFRVRPVLAVFFLLLAANPREVGAEPTLSKGETVYVAVYSNVYSGPKGNVFELASMLSLRNTDMKHPITVLQADYYDSAGKRIQRYIQKPIELAPLASRHYYIPERDKSGGPGANFIVKWNAARPVNQPVIEGIMLGLTSGQGVSFVSPGRIIRED